MTDVVCAIVFAVSIGWVVHKLMGRGNHGTGLLHYGFVGDCGIGIGMLIETVTGIYASSIPVILGLCVLYSCIVEWIIRRIKHRLRVREVHRMGWLTQDDIKAKFDISSEDPEGWENVESEDED